MTEFDKRRFIIILHLKQLQICYIFQLKICCSYLECLYCLIIITEHTYDSTVEFLLIKYPLPICIVSNTMKKCYGTTSIRNILLHEEQIWRNKLSFIINLLLFLFYVLKILKYIEGYFKINCNN